MFNFSIFRQTPFLIATSAVACVQPNQPWIQPAQCVQAKLALTNSPEADVFRVWDSKIRVDIVQVPFERFAFETRAKGQSLLNTEKID